MALRVRYEQTLLFFYNMKFLYRDSSMKEGLFPIWSYVSRVNFSVTNHFSSTLEVSFLSLCYEKKSQKMEKIIWSFLDRIKKKLWDC